MQIRRPRDRWVVAWSLALACCGQVNAQQLVVGAGAALVLGDGRVDAGCNDLRIDGTLDIGAGVVVAVRDLTATGALRGGSGEVQLSGDLSAAAALQAQNGTVRLGDGCGRSQSMLVGAHRFNRLRMEGSGSHAMVLPAGLTQDVLSELALLGNTGTLLDLHSDTPGAVAFIRLAPSGAQVIDRVSVIDVGGSDDGAFLAPNRPAAFRSIDRGNSPNFFADNVPIPTMTPRALALLALLVGVVALVSMRLRPRGPSDA